MIISHKHKFIFFAIPRTGTHAIRFALRPFLGEEDWEQVGLFKNSLIPISEIAKIGHGHISVNQIKPHLSEKQWKTYFKFTIVRNPLDRFVSYCCFKRKNEMEFNNNPKAFMKSMVSHDKKFHNDILSQSQSNFILNENGECEMDYIMYQENLQKDFDVLMDKLNFPKSILDVVNRSVRKKTSDYYDDDLKKRVIDYYKKDMEYESEKN
jgi:hypothetical protein